MADDVQPPDPPAALLDVARQVVPAWVRRITLTAAAPAGLRANDVPDDIDPMVDRVSTGVLRRLEDLLDTDVDQQRTTPLSLFRDAVAEPTAWLRAHDVPPPARPADVGFPDDVYGLGPATWADIDPAMHEPGLRWGAWKAMTVLARRRDEGLR